MYRRIFLGVLILVCISTYSFSSTRQDIQVALDLIRFTNVANDLLDEGALIARESEVDIADTKNTKIML